MTVSSLDLTHAVYFNTNPMYTTAAADAEYTTLPETDHPMLEDAAFEEITNFLLDLQDITELDTAPTMREPTPPEPAITPSSFEHEVQHWHDYLAEAAEHMTANNDGALANACSLAAGLHLAATSAIVPSPVRLQAQRDELFSAMVVLADNAWDAQEAVHVRM